jgi:hypothetical protein
MILIEGKLTRKDLAGFDVVCHHPNHTSFNHLRQGFSKTPSLYKRGEK